ncbi:hypothetical protein PsorP6_014771 [Peronosclerospora sorghi]|uniref:Uncharacterized protein n=1 Tax=Peronosclerospora sorghi TaxID=230839 RepID=A0ACC0VTC7_9STRA|nr:hypothetical protein PsorP6_014771 [Peronosclerospora sorghi]
MLVEAMEDEQLKPLVVELQEEQFRVWREKKVTQTELNQMLPNVDHSMVDQISEAYKKFSQAKDEGAGPSVKGKASASDRNEVEQITQLGGLIWRNIVALTLSQKLRELGDEAGCYRTITHHQSTVEPFSLIICHINLSNAALVSKSMLQIESIS